MRLKTLFSGCVLSCSLVLAAWTDTASAQTPLTYYFWQSGFQGGGVLSGSFSGADLDKNSQLSGFSGGGEVDGFSVSMTGNSQVPDFTIPMSGLWGLVYDLNEGPFLGDGRIGNIEGIGATGSIIEGGTVQYKSGQGPNGFDGGLIEYSGGSIMTLNPVMLSLSPITPEIYQETLASVPEPGTASFAILSLGMLVAWRRKNAR